MIYVVDNNIFSIAFNNIPMDVFTDIWGPWSVYMQEGKIISVEEVYRELENRWTPSTGKDQISQWLKAHKDAFLKPTNEEGYVLQEIFRNKKFREGVKEKSLRNGTPEADAFLVAKAKCISGIVVTAESDEKPNSEVSVNHKYG